MDRLQRQLVDYAAQVQRREAELAELDQQVILLETTRAAKLAGLENQRSDLGALAGGAAATVDAAPGGPDTGISIAAGHGLERGTAELCPARPPGQGFRLKQELADIQSLRDDAEKQRREIATAAESLRGVREGIKRLVAQKASLRRITEEDRAAPTGGSRNWPAGRRSAGTARGAAGHAAGAGNRARGRQRGNGPHHPAAGAAPGPERLPAQAGWGDSARGQAAWWPVSARSPMTVRKARESSSKPFPEPRSCLPMTARRCFAGLFVVMASF